MSSFLNIIYKITFNENVQSILYAQRVNLRKGWQWWGWWKGKFTVELPLDES